MIRLLRSRYLALALVPVIGGCLPIPNRVTETIAVSGVLLDSSTPQADRQLSVEQPKFKGPGRVVPCSGSHAVSSDAAGGFHSPERSDRRMWMPLLGEAPDWRIPLRVCLREGETWRPLFVTRVNGWDPELRITCDVSAPWRKDENRGEEGVCVRDPVVR